MLVTGCSSGIGLFTAIEFAKKNFSKELYGQSIENVYNNILSINKDSKGNNEKKL